MHQHPFYAKGVIYFAHHKGYISDETNTCKPFRYYSAAPAEKLRRKTSYSVFCLVFEWCMSSHSEEITQQAVHSQDWSSAERGRREWGRRERIWTHNYRLSDNAYTQRSHIKIFSYTLNSVFFPSWLTAWWFCHNLQLFLSTTDKQHSMYLCVRKEARSIHNAMKKLFMFFLLTAHSQWMDSTITQYC